MTVVGFVDDAMSGGYLGGIPIIDRSLVDATQDGIIVAIGDASARRRIQREHVENGRQLITIVHPAAVVSPSATVGVGVFVGANSVVNAEAVVGDGVIVNSRAVVEHHAMIGAFSHIAPGATLAGSTEVGSMSLVGIGASVLPGIKVGSNCTVGAGAVVTTDVADGATVVGSPAKPV
jgi:sugar O-acyltransferase (sialic acid O-acetyltransferase NeuD family)